ncbi:hypothetical protein ABHN11_24720 [Brevibacillus centrosporus]|uniref:hypothetical protein n=1 Tax=Brevibacillus centrosporus TaxID=54910 RepID=UPI003D194F8C
MFQKKTPEQKSMEEKLSRLRVHFNNMTIGKRILLYDGRIGYFQGYSGTAFNGETFSFQHNGKVEDVSLIEYAAVLINNESVKCPACESSLIMDTYLSGTEQTTIVLRENITDDALKVPSYNVRSIRSHTCYACGYMMLFAKLSK